MLVAAMPVLLLLLAASSSSAVAPPPPPPPPAGPMPNPGMVFPGDGRRNSHGQSIPAVPGTADCAIREAAWRYGKKLMPHKKAFADLFDALQLGNGCGVAPPPPPELEVGWAPLLPTRIGERVLFVEPTTSSAPAAGLPVGTFATVGAAVLASRSMAKPLTIALRDGVHHLEETLQLGAQVSHFQHFIFKPSTFSYMF